MSVCFANAFGGCKSCNDPRCGISDDGMCLEASTEESEENASAKAMLLFERTATVLKELPRSTGAQARSAGNDSYFSLEDDLGILKRHWFNITTGAAKENASTMTTADRKLHEKKLHRESNRKWYLRAGTPAPTSPASRLSNSNVACACACRDEQEAPGPGR